MTELEKKLNEIDEALSYYTALRVQKQAELTAAESGNVLNGLPFLDIIENKITGTERLKTEAIGLTETINSLQTERARILQSMGVDISGKPVNILAVVALVVVAIIIVKKIM